MRRVPRLLRLPSSRSIGPEKLLLERSSFVRLLHEPSALGIIPSSRLLLISMYDNPQLVPKSADQELQAGLPCTNQVELRHGNGCE
uniref:Uncharacterized protein n=1 Tax=Oryza rufipogon TaxID=4529 RepID=A0A0E0QWE3_ORYRU